MIPADQPRDVIDVSIRYWYKGRMWVLRFDMNATDPVRSIYFSEAEAAAAREAIGQREERHAPLGEEWEWEEQGVRNELVGTDAGDGGDVRQESEGGVTMTSSAVYAVTQDDGTGRAEVTTCWHHRSCLWSCIT